MHLQSLKLEPLWVDTQTFRDDETTLCDTVMMDLEIIQCKELTVPSAIMEVNLPNHFGEI